MIKKLGILLGVLLLTSSIPGLAQTQHYFPDRLIIKYKSDQTLSRIKAKTGTNPKTAVEQILAKNGMRRRQSLFPSQMERAFQQSKFASVRSLERIREVIFNKNIDLRQLAAKISRMPGVAYAEPRYIHHMFYTPSDSVIEKFVKVHHFEQAWNITKGSPNVTIAIVDGGVNYLHWDLDDKLWINQDEVPATLRPQVDENGDGRITSTEIEHYLYRNDDDYNGDGTIDLEDALDPNSAFMDNLDNDNNSFVDDLFGWDFWDSGDITSPNTDNNPLLNATDHGTHVAGIAAAETDNDTAVAAAGFNSRYMAVKAGGNSQDPESIGYGFSGIIYAAQQGADVINCSWGSSSYSQAEQDVINAVTDMGSLVIAAAGNETAGHMDYPAGYDNVVAVGAIDENNVLASYSNFGYHLDVLATGNDIRSTSYNNSLVSLSGTSMATPVVSGLAALVKAIHPGWSPRRIGQQIRASAQYIYNTNSGDYDNKLGHGSIDAYRALDTNLPGLKIVSHRFVDSNGEKLTPGEQGQLHIRLTNLGNATSNLVLQLQSLNNGTVNLSSTTRQLGSVANGDTVNVAFSLTITGDFDLSKIPTFRLNFSDNAQNYDDFNILQYNSLLFDLVAANHVKTSFAADGTVGFTNPISGLGGVGFIPRTPDGSGGYKEGDNLLFEGGLIIEANGHIYDATRTSGGEVSRDFVPQQVFSTQQPGDVSDIDGQALFTFGSDTTAKLSVALDTYAFDNPQLSNVVYLKYTLQNESSLTVAKNLYLGLFNDWDIGDASQNNVAYSKSDSVLYISDASSGSTQPVVAVAQLSPISSVLAIDNTVDQNTDSVTFGLYDGFTDTEKRNALHAQMAHTTIQNTDVSAVTASGPYTLNPGAKVTIGFVYAFGDDLSQLRNQIAQARSQKPFAVSPLGRAVSDKVPMQTKLYQNFPNPFSSSTQIRFDLKQDSRVALTVYDVLGRRVKTLVDKSLKARTYYIDFAGKNLSSGVYFVRLKTKNGVQTIPVTLIK